MKPPPNKHFRLLCWWLTYRLPLKVKNVDYHIPTACALARMTPAAFHAAREAWPRALEKVGEKRERRRRWLAQHGSIPPGWTPPDPQDRRTANYPEAALRRRMSGWRRPRGDVKLMTTRREQR
jgi:hypothetical protein